MNPSKIICVEEHFSLPGFATSGPNQREILDLETLRLEAMDRAGVDVMVLSLNSPGVQTERDTATAVRQATEANDTLSKLVAKHPKRFVGLATLALQDPKGAVAELDRSVRQLGLRGVMVNGQSLGRYLDEDEFSPLWAKAEELGVPIYIHPAYPEIPWKVFEGYAVLASSGAGWAYETAGHALRCVLGGVFERFPKAMLMIGHMGETIPFGMWRLDNRWTLSARKKPLPHPPSFYIKRNLAISTSGVFSRTPLICALDALGPDAIMFAVDYPHESLDEGVKWLKEVDIDPAFKAKLAHGNAERLFGI